jgi:hypothetical protein
MPFAHLGDGRIKEIRTFFLLPHASYDGDLRVLLMNGIAAEFVEKLRKFDDNFNQLAGDLISLNSLECLKNGSVPLRIWLDNAKSQFEHLPQAVLFDDALSDMATGPAERSDTDVIVEGIEALWELIRKDPAAYQAVVFYREIFQKALWEIDAIIDYKEMHDALHKLQLNWPDDTVVQMFLSLKSPMLTTLINYSASLNGTAKALIETYSKGHVDGAERQWIEELEVNQRKLDASIELERKERDASDPEPNQSSASSELLDLPDIEEAFEIVKSQLTLRLSLLNDRLKAAINRMHLRDLIEAMNTVCTVFRRLSPQQPPKQLERYEAGVKELNLLDDELIKLMADHDKWQGADSLLRTLGETFRKSADLHLQAVQRAAEEELERKLTPGSLQLAVEEAEKKKRLNNVGFVVVAIETTVEPLRTVRTTYWSDKLAGTFARLKVEISKNNADKAEEEFDNYRHAAWQCFFELDREMKYQCDELRTIAQSLHKVNDELKVNYVLEFV